MKKNSLAIVITSYREPNTGRAIQAILDQKIDYPYEIIVSAPDIETQKIVTEYEKKDERVILFTDGDVYVGANSVNEVADLFENSKIGCVSGRPYPLEDKNTKYRYWAHFLFREAHRMRKNSFLNGRFLECSGYLFAIRNHVIESFPLDTAEDTIIPYFFWEKGYRIGYANKALVYVKNVDNWKDWISQKVRTTRAHENLGTYVDIQSTPRDKTFLNESKGVFRLFNYAENVRQFFWGIELMFVRIYMWLIVFWLIKIKGEAHKDGWKRVESSK
jgi:cellulose synthase/poly-beta-1,6-N-acetylglucosamine synthase-like glycosyltransferase